MIPFFLTPYPDEWWYSILCRMYVHGGYRSDGVFRAHIYGNQQAKHSLFSPDNSIAQGMRRIPEAAQKIFPLERILKNHTLLPYYTRLQRLEQKNNLLSILPEKEFLREPTQTLKYCPQCYAEDVAVYGEPYWHRTHQVSLTFVCPKHKCALFEVVVPTHVAENVTLPLSQLRGTPLSVVPKAQEISAATSLALHSAWEVCMHELYRVFGNFLEEKALFRKSNRLLNQIEIWDKLVEGFGETVVRNHFRGEFAEKLDEMLTCKIGDVGLFNMVYTALDGDVAALYAA